MIIIPRPLPGEYFYGHMGRIRQFHELINFDATVVLLRGVDVIKGEEDLLNLLINNVATLCGMSAHTYESLHSFTNGSSCRTLKDKLSNEFQNALTAQFYKSYAFSRASAYFCDECIIEDLELRGYAYWRRSHQIPGMDWCSKHRSLLWKIDDKTAFEGSPFHSLSRGRLCNLEADYE